MPWVGHDKPSAHTYHVLIPMNPLMQWTVISGLPVAGKKSVSLALDNRPCSRVRGK